MSRAIATPMMTVASILLVAARAAAGQELPPLQVIVDAIRTQEHGLLNVQVVAHHDREQWDEAAGEWAYAGEEDLRAWLTGQPDPRARVDSERRIAPWLGGAAPFLEDSYRIAYNGEATKYLMTRTGAAGSASNLLRGELAAGRTAGIDAGGGQQSGLTFTVLGASRLADPNSRRLSEYLEAVVHAGRMPVEVFTPEAGARGDVGVRIVQPNGQQHIFYFDSSIAYALVGGEFRGPNGLTRDRWTAYNLQCVAPGVYYPTFAVRESFEGDGRPRYRSTFTASEIIANDPAWSDDVFDPPWPPGTVIDDKIAGTVYQIGPSGEQLEAAVDKQIGELVTGMRAAEGAQSRPAKPPTTPTGPASQLPPNAGPPTPVVRTESQSVPPVESKPAALADTQPATSSPHDVIVYTPSKPTPVEPPPGERGKRRTASDESPVRNDQRLSQAASGARGRGRARHPGGRAAARQARRPAGPGAVRLPGVYACRGQSVPRAHFARTPPTEAEQLRPECRGLRVAPGARIPSRTYLRRNPFLRSADDADIGHDGQNAREGIPAALRARVDSRTSGLSRVERDGHGDDWGVGVKGRAQRSPTGGG